MRISNRLQKTLIVGLLVVVCVLGSAASAFAAEKVTKVTQISYAFLGSPSDGQLMLNVTLPESVKLPAELEFNFPMQTKIAWAGEILGGDSSKDPQVEVTKVSGDSEMTRYKVTLTKSRVFQAEGSENPPMKNADAETIVETVGYKPATDTDSMILAAEIPKTGTIVQQNDIQQLGDGSVGVVYGYDVGATKAGEGKSAEIAYKTTANAAQKGSTGNNTLVVVLVVFLVLAVMGLIIIAASTRAKKAQEGHGGSSKKVIKGSSPAAKAQNSSRERAEETKAAAPKKTPKKNETVQNDSANNEQAEEGEKTGLKPKTLALIITAVVILIAAVAIVAAGMASNKVSEVNGVYYREFAQGNPCQEVHFELTDAALSNPSTAADKVFDKLANAGFQILSASLDPEQRKLTVKFCESETTSAKVEGVLEGDQYIGQSDAVALGEAIVEQDGSVSMYYTEVAPCVLDTFKIENTSGDVSSVAKKLYDATKSVPSMARMNYNPDTKISTFGFCDEQAGDKDLEKALKAAGFKVNLTQKATAPETTNN